MIRKILVIDNSKAILKMLPMMLERQGYETKTAENGLAALELLETYRPDVIFVDMVMPKISGDKLCPILRSMPELKNTYIVILSAIAAEQDIDFKALGADACIAKGPFKDIEKDITDVLNLFKKRNTAALSDHPVGTEKLFKREITRELLSIQTHYAIALNNMSDGFLELTPDQKIVFANTAATEIFDTPELKLLATRFTDIFDDDQRDRIEQALKELGERPIMLGEFTPVIHKSRHLVLNFVPVKDQGVKSIVVVIHDITQRKTGEKKLAEYYERLEKTFTEHALAHRDMQEKLESENAARQKAEEERERLADELQDALAMTEALCNLLPFCKACQKNRHDLSYRVQIEAYIQDRTETGLHHDTCPGCGNKL